MEDKHLSTSFWYLPNVPIIYIYQLFDCSAQQIYHRKLNWFTKMH